MNHTLIFNVTGKTSIWQRNHGAYRIAHWLRLHNWDAEVIDYALTWNFEDLTNLVETRISKNTKFIGFSFLFDRWRDSEDLLKFVVWLNHYYPNITLISGSNLYPDPDSPMDYHIRGYGEVALVKLLEYLFSNGVKPRMIERNDGIIVIDADLYPAYPMTDYSVEYEARDFLQPWEFLSIETARGCIFQCTFCNHPLLGVKEDYSVTSEAFDKELKENYYRWGIKNYMTTEETFNDRPDKIERLGKVVKNLDFEPWFTGYIRVDLLISRPDERKHLDDMNYYGHYYGVESFYHKTAKAFKKGMHPDKIKEGLLSIKEYYAHTGKYRGTVSLILGGPYEPIDSMYKTFDWLEENWKEHSVMPYPMYIPQGEMARASELTKNYEKYGYRKKDFSYFEEKYPDEEYVLNRMKTSRFEAILWENDELDQLQAIKLEMDFHNKIRDKEFKVQNFSMPKYTAAKGSNNQDPPMEERLNLTVGEAQEEWGEKDDTRDEWCKEYITKKLNWGQSIVY